MHLVCGNNVLLNSDLGIVILLISPLKFKVGSHLFRITFPQIFSGKCDPANLERAEDRTQRCVSRRHRLRWPSAFYTPELDTLQKQRSPVPGRRSPCLRTSAGFLAALRLIGTGSTLLSLFSFTLKALPKLQKLCGKKSFNFHSQCMNPPPSPPPPAFGNDFFILLFFGEEWM